MKEMTRFLIAVIVLAIGYALFLMFGDGKSVRGAVPVISFNSDKIEVSVDSGDKALLKGVSATDDEDGNLTKYIFVEDVSPFNENLERTVTYGVFDSDDNLTRMTRTVKYKDYSKPVFDIKKPLVYYIIHNDDEFKDYVSAYSEIDGDLSSRIIFERKTLQDDGLYVTLSVTDSCGVKESITLKADELNYDPQIQINLTQNLVRLKVGEDITSRNFIESVTYLGLENRLLKERVDITTNHQVNKPGTYEYIYKVSADGDYGVTKLVVIVEE